MVANVCEYHPCLNAYDLRREFALVTDNGLHRFALRFGITIRGNAEIAIPASLAEGERFLPRRIDDVRVLHDGRVAAVVVTSNQPLEAQGSLDDGFLQPTTFLFVADDVGYLVDDDVAPFTTNGAPTP
ncbi:MAG: hypothetical protein AVDCRST_MAG19-481 [uncultured Thermomicrobiales bacterium]|uniref:Uncharacterized protein n=1 Tax=uncultured Thermomicrobiales bacterium TaxID=1645740 RepID=A0A6J4UHC0_9BACT|nr:MAG: hypothetical protein AVDCRST_MAG19-481 [uncultured Thermomicrobiales bacterium]